MRQRTWISRSEIAEIYDQRARLAMQREKETPFSDNGNEIEDLKARADLMREIDDMENKNHLNDHRVMTREANFEAELEGKIVRRRKPKSRRMQLVALPTDQEIL